MHLDYVSRPERRGFVIVGDNGSIEVDLVQRQAFRKNIYGQIVATFYGKDSYDQNYIDEIAAFLDRLDGKQTIGCNADEGLSVARLCLEAKEMI